MRFSDRIGVTEPKKLYQSDDIDDDLRNRLWNGICEEFINNQFSEDLPVKYRLIFDNLIKIPNDSILDVESVKYNYLRDYYFQCEWDEIYNLLEFMMENFDEHIPLELKMLREINFNKILEEEKSAYRFVDKKLVPISDETEIKAVSAAANLEDRFSGAREHIRRALEAFARKPNPDYSNAIKEAIFAVESAAKVISGNGSATLGDAVRSLNEQKPMHPAFKIGIEKLYGYTSDEGGIRHAMLDDNIEVDESDAHFMIVTCSAFVNFVVSRYR